MSTNLNILKAKKEYLVALYDEENDRQKILEGKCFLLMSNSGIFISLIGLLITLLLGQKDPIPVVFKVIISFLIINIILGFGYCMHFALKVLNSSLYPYSRGNPATIDTHKIEEDFYDEILIDYQDSINTNLRINNTKADHLMYARKGFVFAINFTMLLTISLVVYACFFYKVSDQKVQQVVVKNFEFEKNINKLKSGLDSINKTLKTKPISLKKRKSPISTVQNNETFYISNP